MTPKDLKTGHICEHASGQVSMVMKDTCENYANKQGGNLVFHSMNRTDISTFNDDFTWSKNTTAHQKSVAIVAVYEPFNLCNSVAIFERTFKGCLSTDFKCIWKRPPEGVEELTLE